MRMTHCVDCGWLLDPKYGPHDLCATCADMLFALLRPPAGASAQDPEWNCRIWYHRTLEQRFDEVESMDTGGPQAKISGGSQMKVRQALVCGDCGAIIEDEHLPEEEDWTCPECGRGSNLELTLVIGLETNDAR